MKSPDEKSKTNKNRNHFASLTWLNLESWAGARTVSRGKSYQRGRRVRDLAITGSGELIAWVQGSSRYATKAGFGRGRLVSSCTCPVGTGCKHAVAVVLEYLDALKSKRNVPALNAGDVRLELIRKGSVYVPHEDVDDLEDAEKDDADEWDAEIRIRPSRDPDDVHEFLKGKSSEELASVLSEIAENHPAIRKELKFKARMARGSAPALVRTISREIDSASSEGGWQDHWRDEGFTPDFSRVRSGIQQLLNAGHADEVVQLGKRLFRKGTELAGQSDDEGETIQELGETLHIVFRALKVCSMTNVDKMSYAVSMQVEDEYDLTDGIEEFWKKKFGRKDWNGLADRLLDQLKEMKDPGPDHSSSYRRDRLSDEILNALEKAGRHDEILPLCMQEADRTHSYERLVKRLRQAGKIEAAEEWIRKGIEATREKWPGVAGNLKSHLLEIKIAGRDWAYAAALKADSFFASPSLRAYQELEKSAAKAKVWEAVREVAIEYLHTGKRPRRGVGSWTLPDTGFEKAEDRPYLKPPFTDVLIDIAICENDIDEALRLYDAVPKRDPSRLMWSPGWSLSVDEKVAEAAKNKYPDRAVAIWKKIAESYIDQVNPKSYSAAGQFLRKIQQVLKANGKAEAWNRYLGELRAAHARKPRLLQVLDSLSGKAIIAG
jgi:uncharacterized Zn finger protein